MTTTIAEADMEAASGSRRKRQATCRVLLAHGQALMREGLKLLLAKSGVSLKVVADAADGPTAVQLVEEHKPDLALLDVALPGINGIDATRHISRRVPGIRVLLLSAAPNGRSAAAGLQAGAMGFLCTSGPADELERALESLLEARTYLSPMVADLLVDQYVRHPENRDDFGQLAQLTPRQHQILQLVADGRSTKEIARSLKLSPKTVDAHRKELMERLDVDSIAALTKFALRAGLTTLDG